MAHIYLISIYYVYYPTATYLHVVKLYVNVGLWKKLFVKPISTFGYFIVLIGLSNIWFMYLLVKYDIDCENVLADK